MQRIEYRLRELRTDAVRQPKVADAGARDALPAAELLEQLAALSRPEARDGFKQRFTARFRAASSRLKTKRSFRK